MINILSNREQSRQNVLVAYKAAYESFTIIIAIINNVAKNIKKSEIEKRENIYPVITMCAKTDLDTLNRKLDSFIVKPEDAYSVNITKVIDSADFLRRIAPRLKTYWKEIGREPENIPLDQLTGFTEDIYKHLEIIRKTTYTIQENSAGAVRQEEASDELADYFRSYMDMTGASKNYERMVRELYEYNSVRDKKDSSTITNLKDKIKGIVKAIEDKFQLITDRLSGFASALYEVLKDSLNKFPGLIEKAWNLVVNTLQILSERFYDIISKLIEQLFKFLSCF